MRKILGRRSFLRATAALPLVGNAVAQEAKMKMAGLDMLPDLSEEVGVARDASGPTKFFRFSDLLKKFGDQYKERADSVSCLDPDIVEMHLPLATKVRMQRERNYERIIESEKRYFERELSVAGFVSRWV
ncbi:MAG: hypothetical protein ACPG4X_14600 [Pikeienuella sp.]